MFTEKHVVVPAIRVIEAFFRFILVAGVIGGGVFAYFEYFVEPVTVSNEELIEAFQLDEESFREVLQDNKSERFLDVIDSVQYGSAATYEQKLRILDNQILASQKIAKTRLTQQKIFGLTHEIELLTERAFFNLENDTYDLESNDALLELGKLYKSVQFPDQSNESDALIERAKVGEIVAEYVRLVETTSVEKDSRESEELLKKIGQISEFFLSSSDLGVKLGRMSELTRGRLVRLEKSTRFADHVDNLLLNIEADNITNRIKELAEMDCETTFAETLSYTTEEQAGFKDKFVAQFREKLNQVLEVDEISNDDFVMIVTKLDQISEAGWPKEAAEMLESVVSVFPPKAEASELRQKIGKLESRLGWVGQPFSLDGLQTLENREPSIDGDSALATMVIYISLVNQAECDTRFKQLGRIYNNIFKNAKIDFLVVFMHEDDQRNGLQTMRVLDDRMKPVDFLQMNVNSEFGKEFSKTLDIESTPYVKILDRERRVVALNPNANRLTELFNTLKARESAE